MKLQSKVAIVNGSATGISKAIATAMASEGAGCCHRLRDPAIADALASAEFQFARMFYEFDWVLRNHESMLFTVESCSAAIVKNESEPQSSALQNRATRRRIRR